MNCRFHEARPAVRICTRCKKALCEDCYHTDYPEYCWGCGLDYDNSLGEIEQDIEMPEWLPSAPVQYVIVKLAAAGGSWIGVTLAGSFVLGMLGVPIGITAIYFAIFSICVVYTYGLACAVLVDLTGRFVVKMSDVVRAIVYAVLGSAFPWVVNLVRAGDGLYHQPINMLTGCVAALLFWGVERLQHKRSMIYVLAFVGTSFLVIVFIMLARGEFNLWRMGMDVRKL